MNKFIKDFKKHWNYMKFSAKSDLKSEVANSRLNWLWWILDPILFMMVYTFISAVVFKKTEKYFAVYVFVGITAWTFFSKTVQASVKIVKNNASIIRKVYIPKFAFITQRMIVNGFKMIVSFVLVFILMIIYKVPLSWHILYVIPVLLTMLMVTFGISTIVLHFGVYVEDLNNVVSIGLKLMFYLSGVFYSIDKNVPEPYNSLMIAVNPMAGIISDFRRCLIYNQTPNRKYLLMWFVIGAILSIIGIRTIYKNENNYAKVI